VQGSLIANIPQNTFLNLILKKQIRNAVLLVGISAVLISCGGGSSGGVPPPPEKTGTIQGNTYIGNVFEGNVNIYEFKEGVRGSSLTTTTQINSADGSFTVNIKTPSKSLLVCLSGARYTEVTSQASVKFTDGQELCAITNYISGDTVAVILTYYSHVSVGLATRLLQFSVNPTDAVNDSNLEISNWVGYNIHSIKPRDITDVNDTAGQRIHDVAGFSNAAISVYTGWVNGVSGIPPKDANGNPNPKRHSVYNSILFAQRAFEDIIADGQLDGQSANGPTGLGAVALSTKTYRHDIALDMLVLVNNAKNLTTIKSSKDLFNNALDFSLFDDPNTATNSQAVSKLNIFGGISDPTTLSSVEPVLNNFIIPKVVVGDINLAVSMTDFIDQTKSVEYRITNPRLGVNDQIALHVKNIPTDNITRTNSLFSSTGISQSLGTVYPDAKDYKIDITATYDVVASGTLNQKVKRSKSLIIGNTGTQIEGRRPVNDSAVTGTFNLFAGISNPLGISSIVLTIDDLITVQPSNFTPGASNYNVPIFRIDTRTVSNGSALLDGSRTFKITVTDNSGSNLPTSTISTNPFSLTVDNTPPTINTTPPVPPISGWFTNSFDIGVATSDATSGVANFKIIMDGGLLRPIFSPTANELVSFPLFGKIADGTHIIRVQATDKAGLTSFDANTVIVRTDANIPTLTFTPVGVTAYTLPASCMMTVSAADPVSAAGGIGSGIKSVTVDGIAYGAISAPIQINLQSKITIAATGGTQQVILSAVVEDVAGHSKTYAVTLDATRGTGVTASNYTCTVSAI